VINLISGVVERKHVFIYIDILLKITMVN